MQIFRCSIAIAALAAVLLAGCAAPSASKPRGGALLMSGDVVTYGAQGTGTRVSVAEVDGKPVSEPHGPIELAPGHHTINLACEGASSLYAVNAAAGEIYRFRERSKPGARGCTGALTRVRNP